MGRQRKSQKQTLAGQVKVSKTRRTGRLMKNMVTAPTMGTSPISGSRITRIMPWSCGRSRHVKNPEIVSQQTVASLGATSASTEVMILREKTNAHLYSFHSSFAEVPFDLDIDLNVSNVAVAAGRGTSLTNCIDKTEKTTKIDKPLTWCTNLAGLVLYHSPCGPWCQPLSWPDANRKLIWLMRQNRQQTWLLH